MMKEQIMKKNKSLNVAWQDPNTKSWHVVGLLSETEQGYSFNYTNGALKSDLFVPFSGMNNLSETYISKELFPMFHNRLLSKRRPEYPNFIRWLGLTDQNTSPIDILSRSGGARSTDKLQTFSKIELDSNNSFEFSFFVHGLSYFSDSAKVRVNKLKQNEKIYLCLDCQNNNDNNAVLMRAEDPAELIGYCPRYFAESFSLLLKDDPKQLKITVESLCEDAPSNYKLLCRVKGTVPKNLYEEFNNNPEFQTIA